MFLVGLQESHLQSSVDWFQQKLLLVTTYIFPFVKKLDCDPFICGHLLFLHFLCISVICGKTPTFHPVFLCAKAAFTEYDSIVGV
jgi:hypothetical protein